MEKIDYKIEMKEGTFMGTILFIFGAGMIIAIDLVEAFM